MGRIRFKTYYCELVEHYFRMAVRNKTVYDDTPLDWFIFTKEWIGMQSEEDREFITFIFGRGFYKTFDGMYCFGHEKSPSWLKGVNSYNLMNVMRDRLCKLERDYAIAAKLVNPDSACTRWGE